MFDSILPILGIILGFGFTILVHEFGHFIMARRAGVKVDTFAIGMGPRLLRLWRDKKGTDYVLAMFPIGGYVKMKGQEDLPFESKEKLDEDNYQSKKPLARMSIILAGVVMNVLFAYVLIVIAFSIGIPFSPNRVGLVRSESPAAKAGLKYGDVITSVDGNKVETGEELLTTITLLDASKTVEVTYVRAGVTNSVAMGLERGTELSPEVENTQAGFLPFVVPEIKGLTKESALYKDGLRNGFPIVGTKLKNGTRVLKSLYVFQYILGALPGESVEIYSEDGEGRLRTNSIILSDPGVCFSSAIRLSGKESPAAVAGLMDGDRVVSINGKKVNYWRDLTRIVLYLSDDSPLNVEVLRNKKKLTFKVKPKYNFQVERYYIGVYSVDRKIAHIAPEIKSLVSFKEGDEVVSLVIDEKSFQYKIKMGETITQHIIKRDKLSADLLGSSIDFKVHEKLIKYSPLKSLSYAFVGLKKEFKEVTSFLSSLIRGKISSKMMGGPLMIFQVSYQIAQTKGLAYLLFLFVKIGITLAIINILPIPVLDGGHAVFILYEMIRRKPAPEIVFRTAHMIGFFMIIVLFIFVLKNDILRMFF